MPRPPEIELLESKIAMLESICDAQKKIIQELKDALKEALRLASI